VKIQTGFLDHFSNELGISVDFIVLGVGKQNPKHFFCLKQFDHFNFNFDSIDSPALN
jgi:hypothetical protein